MARSTDTGDADEAVTVAGLSVSPRDLLGVYLKGMLMGAADTVPGVSGGTIALVTGIYDRLITAISAVDLRDLRALLGIHTTEGRREVLDVAERVDAPFLAALGLGVLTAVVSVARVIEAARTTYPGVTFAAFFGLIAASAVVLYGEVDLTTPRRLALAAVAIVVVGTVAWFGAGEPSGSVQAVPLWYVFVSGVVAICAMVLPGVSGAFLLILLGSYLYMLATLNDFTGSLVGLLDGGAFESVVSQGVVVGAFCTGAVVGLLSVTHVIRWALDRYREATLTVLVSLMVGGLVAPARKVHLSLGSSPDPGQVAAVVAAALVGAGALLVFDHFTDDLEYAD
ncbi:DUF368 domain-containing protein [Halobacteriales archaeon QS_8_69_26]|nr:MAG: DUF368 domain-containing protein [Halobacteriales archaeon QS_8_69_26]